MQREAQLIMTETVLSALEGLAIATPQVQPYIVPAAVAILVALFAIQPQGTARIGRAFGPALPDP